MQLDLNRDSSDLKVNKVSERRRSLQIFKGYHELGTVTGLFIMGVVFTILSPDFITGGNLINILLQSSINIIVALGMTLVIITAGIDLSVGSIAALSIVVSGSMIAAGDPLILAILVGLLLGTVLGAVNGLFITVFGLQPFIVTLGTMSLFSGLALLYTNGQPIMNISNAFQNIFAGNIGVLPVPILYMVILSVIAYIILKRFRLGEYIMAIGGNEEATRVSGIAVNRYKMITYMISGVLSAFAGLVLMGRLGAADPTSGSGWELTAIAASAIGGASLMGGKGSIVGTIFGAIILGTLQDGLTLLNVQSYYQTAATGAIIILAMIIEKRVSRTR